MLTMTEIKPKNAVEALRFAKTGERAKNIIAEGYTFAKDSDSDVIAVKKPGTHTAADYWINMITPGCDCPDYLKRGDYCKHTIAWEMAQAQAADEEAHTQFLIDQYEDRECSTGCDYSDHEF